ncbi:MAG: hypothetical protein IIT39_00965 [Clostridia bacterium]|nr:hypothetical protein [Clostridia bacterium]
MNEYLNISQIARELNVSRQAVYSKLKSPEIQSVMCQYTVRHNNRTLYTSDFVNVLKQTFESVNTVQTLDTICQDEVSSPLQSQLDLLKATIDTLTVQLTEKDKQIAERDKQISDAAEERKQLTAERQTTLAKLFSLQDKNEKLQLELNEYKSIVDSKQNVIEVDAVPTKEQTPAPTEQEQQPEKELAEDPPQQKLSFFQRLFKRSKNQ